MASRTIFSMSISVIVILVATTAGMTTDGYWNNNRDYESIVLKGLDIKNFVATPIHQIYLYKYNLAANLWTPIPFQIDQKDDSSHYWLPAPNDTLDTNDELVFMARDIGDKAPDNTFWIDDPESRKSERIELAVTDTLDERQGWVYLYRSKNLLPTSSQSYMSYKTGSAGADTVLATSYIEGHNGSGITDYLICTMNNNLDILDRQKMQIDLLVNLWGTLYPLTVHEDLLESPNLTTVILKRKVGPVRIIRQVYWHVNIGFGYPPIDFSLPLLHYPFSVESGGISGTLKESNHVNYIRQSFDLNSKATGMKLFNPFNRQGITIDGIGGHEVADSTVLDEPAVNWWMVTGNQGTYAIVFKVAPIGDTRSLYYYDNSTEGDDTGDRMSWGDTGIQIKGKDIAGRISFAYKAYYLGANRAISVGDSLATNFAAPMKVSPESNFYVPVELATFQAFEFDGKVVLEWIAESELNNFGFEVQRKENEIAGWEKIGFVEGKGTTAAPQKYVFEDGSVNVGAYYYRLKQIDFDGSFEFSKELFIEIQAPTTFALDQNYPNPFNPETMIHYQIPALSQASVFVEIKIFNLLGDEVRTLVQKNQSAGFYSAVWDGKDAQGARVAAGTYVYQIKAGAYIQARKMLLLR